MANATKNDALAAMREHGFFELADRAQNVWERGLVWTPCPAMVRQLTPEANHLISSVNEQIRKSDI